RFGSAGGRGVMSSEGRHRPSESRGLFGRFARSALRVLWPTERLLWTREGFLYIIVWAVLLVLGLQQQINLILLVAGLAAGPVARVGAGRGGGAGGGGVGGQKAEAREAGGRPRGPAFLFRGRPAAARLHAGDRPPMDRGAGAVRRGRDGAGRPHGLGRLGGGG